MPGIQQFDTTMHMLSKVLDLRESNQQVISSNIANAETPGYSAKKFTFQEQLKSAMNMGKMQPVSTHADHFAITPGDFSQVRGQIDTIRDTTGLGDENSVSVEQEMINLSENQILYETAAKMLKKKFGMLKYVTNSGGQ